MDDDSDVGGDWKGEERRRTPTVREVLARMDGQDRLAAERQATIMRRLSHLESQIEQIPTMQSSLKTIETAVKPLEDDVKIMKDVWMQANGGIRLLVWVSALASGAWLLVLWARDHIKL